MDGYCVRMNTVVYKDNMIYAVFDSTIYVYNKLNLLS